MLRRTTVPSTDKYLFITSLAILLKRLSNQFDIRLAKYIYCAETVLHTRVLKNKESI